MAHPPSESICDREFSKVSRFVTGLAVRRKTEDVVGVFPIVRNPFPDPRRDSTSLKDLDSALIDPNHTISPGHAT